LAGLYLQLLLKLSGAEHATSTDTQNGQTNRFTLASPWRGRRLVLDCTLDARIPQKAKIIPNRHSPRIYRSW
jgi:hypothetical protein